MTAETRPSSMGAHPVPRGDGPQSPPNSSPPLGAGRSGTAGAEQGPAPAAATPVVATTRDELALALAALRGAARRVALVPTMGALHAGHRALVVRARELADAVVVSIFVNPLQFGPTEDFGRYPRPFDADLAVCTEEQVAVVFAPAREVMYAREPRVTIEPGPMGAVLEGTTRPGHFAGVLTVVTKLLHLVRPDVAVFGEKDAQQLALIRRLVTDLDFPVRIEAHPIVREPDGLAWSSRNRYLTPAERRTATALSRALAAGAARAASGADAVREHARRVLDDASRAAPPLRLDYLALVDPETFTEVGDGYQGEATLAVAAYVGNTRLIDNMRVTFGQAPALVESQPVSTERARLGASAPPLEPLDAGPDSGETETPGGAEDHRDGGER